MSGETKEVLDSNYGQNDVIINRLIDKMTLFDDNLMSLVFGQNIETTELLLLSKKLLKIVFWKPVPLMILPVLCRMEPLSQPQISPVK